MLVQDQIKIFQKTHKEKVIPSAALLIFYQNRSFWRSMWSVVIKASAVQTQN